MKLTNQLTALIIGSVFGVGAMVVCLAVFAKWSDGAVVGMATVFGTIAVNLIVAVRNQQKTAETLEHQDEKLETIERNTNGLSMREREDIAARAAEAALTRFHARQDKES
jgi:hypothetical protein